MHPKNTFAQDICSKNFFFWFFLRKIWTNIYCFPFVWSMLYLKTVSVPCFCNCPLFESLSPLQVCHVKMGVVQPETVAAVLCYLLIWRQCEQHCAGALRSRKREVLDPFELPRPQQFQIQSVTESRVKSCKRVLKRGLVNKHVNDFPRSYGGIISPDIDKEGTALAGFNQTFLDDTQLHTHALTLDVDTLIVTPLKNI